MKSCLGISPAVAWVIALGLPGMGITSAQAGPCSGMPPALRDMAQVDHTMRQHAMAALPDTQERAWDQVMLVDRVHTRRLKDWLKTCGWPRRSVHGEQAVGDAWLLAQHADQDRRFQARAIQLLALVVKAGEAEPTQLAYLSDRVATALGQPQRYGTQFEIRGTCELVMAPVDDLKQVDARRRELGMPSMVQYRQQIMAHAMPVACQQQGEPASTSSLPDR